MDSVPLAGRGPTQSPDATQEAASATDHFSFADWPNANADGVTVSVEVTGIARGSSAGFTGAVAARPDGAGRVWASIQS